MMAARIAASVLAGALIRKAEGEGGFGAVLAKGDPGAGSILVILLEKGGNPRLFERLLQPDGAYSWQESGSQRIENPREVPDFIARQRRFDPDLWVLELDIASAERFAAEMNEID
ncbi:MAG: hypothetical protein QOG72_2750 [Sphingomonadales bacterium]|jgi:hypothetical protein|nr:hypothetical protein [Sphingomonadales bacterium]